MCTTPFSRASSCLYFRDIVKSRELGCLQAMQESLDHPQTAHGNRGLLSHSSSSKLILQGHGSTAGCSNPPFIHKMPLNFPFGSVTDNLAGAVISQIEDILEQIVDCIIDKKKELVIRLKSRRRSRQKKLEINSKAINDTTNAETRIIRFPGGTPQEAWRFTALLRILELSHEALVTGVVTTKRDMYYRDPELFLKQQVVDRYVDDIAFTFGVRRDSLNIVAAAKGLVAGHVNIFLNDGRTLDCRVEEQGILIPSVKDIHHVETPGVCWLLVVEKEATFRALVNGRFWDKSCAGKGVLVTGKGYPDRLTRAFVRFLSQQCHRHDQQPSGLVSNVFALVDFDPDGLTILSIYKHGSDALAHENHYLLAPKIKLLGITSAVIHNLLADTSQASLRMTARDRRLATLMLQRSVFQEGVEPLWRRELQVMLMLNIKAEIQILGPTSKLEEFLVSKLQSHMLQMFVEHN